MKQCPECGSTRIENGKCLKCKATIPTTSTIGILKTLGGLLVLAILMSILQGGDQLFY